MATKKSEPTAAAQSAGTPTTMTLPDVPGVAIDPTSTTLPDTGGTGSFTVTITEPGLSGTWIVDKDSTATWLTHTPTEPQAVDGAVNYTAIANPDPVARLAHFYVNGKTFTCNQVELGGVVPPDPPVTLPPTPIEPTEPPPPPPLANSGQQLQEVMREKRRQQRMAEKGY